MPVDYDKIAEEVKAMDYDAIAAEVKSGQTPAPSPPVSSTGGKTLAGFGANILSSGAKLAGGLADTAEAAFTAYTKPVQFAEAVPQMIEQAATDLPAYLSKRYGSGQQILDTLYQDPVGFMADLSTVLGGAGGAAKLGGMAKLASGLKKASAISDPIAQAGRAIRAPLAAGARAVGAPEKLYGMALKPSTAGKGGAVKAERKIAQGLEREIPVTLEGEAMHGNRVEGLKARINERIAAIEEAVPEAEIDPGTVAARAEQTKGKYRNVRESKDVREVESAKRAFMKSFEVEGAERPVPPGWQESAERWGIDPEYRDPTTHRKMSVSEAQERKQKTYARLKDRAYGEQKGPTPETEKALGRGLKEDIEHWDEVYRLQEELMDIEPALRDLNREEGTMLSFREDLSKAVRRKHHLLGSGVGPGVAGYALGGPKGAATLVALRNLLDQPGFASKLAIALNRAQRLRSSALTKLSTLERVGETE